MIIIIIISKTKYNNNNIKKIKQKIETTEREGNKSTGSGMIHPRSYLLPM